MSYYSLGNGIDMRGPADAPPCHLITRRFPAPEPYLGIAGNTRFTVNADYVSSPRTS
jgi:hypothetical protein